MFRYFCSIESDAGYIVFSSPFSQNGFSVLFSARRMFCKYELA